MLRKTALTGSSGTFFVASRLAYENFHAAVTLGNAPYVDIIVSSEDGLSTIALQVKTNAWAKRTRGRGDQKVLHHLEWHIGERCGAVDDANFLFALVDLKEYSDLPDIYFVPSTQIAAYFKQWPKNQITR